MNPHRQRAAAIYQQLREQKQKPVIEEDRIGDIRPHLEKLHYYSLWIYALRPDMRFGHTAWFPFQPNNFKVFHEGRLLTTERSWLGPKLTEAQIDLVFKTWQSQGRVRGYAPVSSM